MSKVSVIIPVYNVEPYLERCLDSVINQTLEDIELVIVNDGSTDGSAKICEAYASKDSRIKYICQENQGVFMARKNGFKEVTSDYVTFLDADDWFELDYLEKLYEDIGTCDMTISKSWKGLDGIVVCHNNFPVGLYDTPEKMDYFIDNMLYSKEYSGKGIQPNICGKIFKTDIIKQCIDDIDTRLDFFDEGEIILRAYLKCKVIRISDISGYNYFHREGSSCNSIKPWYLSTVNEFYNSMSRVFLKHEKSESLMQQLQAFCMEYLLLAPKFLGFSPNVFNIRYISPFLNTMKDKKVVLYGAGNIGKNYYAQMLKSEELPVIWVDKQYQKYIQYFHVEPVERLTETEFDYLIIAVLNPDVAAAIKTDLIKMGISEEKILYKTPIEVQGVL